MELTQNIIQRLNQLLAKPALVSAEDTLLLNAFSERYPYFQPVYLLMAKAAANSENHARLLTKASIYNSGILLHRFIYQPQSLKPAEDFNVLAYKTLTKKTDFVTSDNYDNYNEKEISTSEEALEVILDSPSKETACQHSQKAAGIANETVLTDQFIKDRLNETNSIEQALAEEETEREVDQENQNKEIDLITETYNQTSFTDANFFKQESAEQNDGQQIEEQYKVNNEGAELEIQPIQAEKANSTTAIDEPIEESLALSDFFAFENSIADTNHEVKSGLAEKDVLSCSESPNIVSRYEDDELPYTFLWWLQKTRKEHAQIFRPYASVAKPKSNRTKTISEQLQHQYVEHIFYLQPPFIEEAIKNAETTPPIRHKGDEIIEKFIQNDPHIKALNPDQIDNENKAKKSAEDHYELVSETLAEVYVEQMLFHKAIDTYRKLSLKFPEKSRYFADLIQSLEKKI